jgi:hypothetical protein
MTTRTFVSMWMTAGLFAIGCSGKSPATDDALDSEGDPGETLASATEPLPGETGDEGIGESGDETGADDGGSGAVFIVQDVPGGTQCNVWTQDCEEGLKCMPHATSGSSWNATMCTPLHPNAKQPGDECTVEGNGVSGIDDCELGSMCWNVDPETNMGTCVAFCVGSEHSNSCDDPGTKCSIYNGGVLILCLPVCDPLLQNCADGQGCYSSDSGFVCIPDASGPEGGAYGDPCEFVNVCDPGLFCAAAEAVPNCQGSSGCCSEYCDLGQPDAGSGCSGVSGGQECVPWFEGGQAPPGYEDVGACAIPQ